VETIYVSMATVDDTETERSILGLFEKSKHPERIFVGLACSTESKSFYKKLVKSFKGKNVKLDYVKLKPKSFESYGTGQARVRALNMYDNQDYVLQCDSHTNFEQDWDEFLIDTFKEAKTQLNHDKIVLTAYLGMYRFMSTGVEVINSHARYPFYTAGFFNDGYAKWTDAPLSEFDEKYTEKFYPCVKFNGNFAFGDKEFAKNPGTYKEAMFYDEEIIQGINLINNGFYMVYPNIHLPLTHFYYDFINEFGGKRKYFTQYVSDSTSIFIHDLAAKRYSILINDRDYVKKYEDYAKINLRTGLYKNNYYVPEKYF
jgi:hypothetical protein